MSTISFQSGVTANGTIVENVAGAYTVGNSFMFTDLGLGAGTAGDFHNLAAIGGNGVNRGTLSASLIDDALGGGDITGTVSWSYTVNDSLLQDLAVGQQLVETFQVTVLDSEGNALVVPITVTITGTNDAPVFTVGEAAPIVPLVEDSAGATLGASGALTFNDVDVLDTQTISNVSVVASGTTNAALTDSVLKAMLSTPVTSLNTVSGGTLNWSFSAANTNFDYLDAGQTLQLVYTLTLSDGHSGTDTKTITINVQGANDTASISVANLSDTEGNTASSIFNGSISNQVTITDLDASDAAAPIKYVANSGSVAVTTNTGPLAAPAITFNALDGTFSYDRAAFNYLSAGQIVTYTFSFNAQSGNDAAQPKTLTLTINGQNDAPVLTVLATPPDFSVSEPLTGTTILNQLGSFDVTDVDVSNTLTIAEGIPTIAWSKVGGIVPPGVVTALNAGTAFSISDSNGATNLATVDWTLNSTADFNFLATGETLTITYPVVISDGTAQITRNVVVTITGTNDIPVATVDTGSATEGISSNLASAQGVLANDTDADVSDVLSVSAVNGVAGNVATSTAGTSGGTFLIAANGGYTFTPGASFEDLGVGETRTTSIDYTVSDGHGGTDIETLTVTVTGSNDTPVITAGGTVLGTVNDPAGTGSLTPIPQTGSFAFTDIDGDFNNNETPTVSSTLASSVLTGATAAQTDALAALASKFSASINVTGSNGTVDWTFNPTGADVDFLRGGQTATLTFNVVVNDGSSTGNATVTQPVTITIVGSNDLVVDGPNTELNAGSLGDPLLLGVTEVNGPAATVVTQSGNFDFIDGDLTGNVIQIIPDGGTLATPGTLTAVAGAPTLSGQRNVTYTYNNTQGSLDYLANGETATANFIVRVLDQDAGGFLDKYVTVTATGTNDAPVITTSAVTTDKSEVAGVTGGIGQLSSMGSLEFTDVDASQTGEIASRTVVASGTTTGLALNNTQLANLLALTTTQSGAGSTGSIGYAWSAADSAFDYLGVGDTLTLTYTVTVTDSLGLTGTQTITVNVTGSNDQPVVTVGGADNDALARAETDTVLTGSGTLTVTDVDLTDAVTASVSSVAVNPLSSAGAQGGISPATLQAMMTISSHTDLTNIATGTGSLTWNFNSSSQAFNHLAAGETLVLDYVIRIADDASGFVDKTVAVTITGSQDAPFLVAGGDSTETFTEAVTGTQTLATTGSFVVDDLDDSNVLTASPGPGIAVWTGGALASGVKTALEDAFAGSPVFNAITNENTVNWTYNAAAIDLNFLGAGETITVTKTVTVSDGTASVARDIVITINGANDGPTILSTTGGTSIAANEAASGLQTVSGSGSFTSTDVDANDTLSATHAAAAAVWSGGAISSLSGTAQAAILALQAASNLALTPVYDSAMNVLTTSWSYTGSNADLNFLSAGETITLTFPVTVSDGHSGTVVQVITITINGAAEVVPGTPGSDLALNGTDFSDLIDGGAGDDTIAGLEGNDTITGGAGVDTIAGGSGSDTAIYSGAWKDYAISQAAGGIFTITDLRPVSPDGTDHVSTVENFQFSNGTFLASQILNDAPTVANAVGTQSAAEDAAFNFALSATAFADVDNTLGDILSYSATLANGDPLPAWLSFDAGTRTFSGTPINGDVGALALKVTATDLVGASVAANFTLNVTNTDDAPTAIALTATRLTIAENSSTLAPVKVADINVADIDGGTNTLGLAGADKASFVIVGNGLFLKAGVKLDFETKTHYDVAVTVRDGVGLTPDATSTPYVLSLTNVSPETISGTIGNNILIGGRDIDHVFGFAGNDTLSGGGGSDRLTGGFGRDVMTGGLSTDVLVRDVFVFNFASESGKTAATRDIITDFRHLTDDIDLSGIDANGLAAGTTAFSFLAAAGAAFTGVRGQLHWLLINPAGTAGDKTIIEGDINGDKVADFQIELTGLKTLTAADFVL